MTALALGTSSWTFPDWRGTFYPDGLPTQDQLAYYATQFNSVEVNTSFYGLPTPSTVLQWLEAVPDGFTFALKAPRLISHERRLAGCRQESLAYLDVLRSLGSAAAPGFLQLPPSFTRAGEGRKLADYLDWLAIQLEGLQMAVEVRAADLMTEAFATFLAERGMQLVAVERAGVPDLFASWQAAREIQETVSNFLFLRLIGDNRNKLPDDREIRRPQEEALARWAARIAGLLDQGVDVYAYIHNPFEGHSPASVRRLWERIDRLHALPDWSPDPRPADDATGQLSLF